jgi:hypothetical protein
MQKLKIIFVCFAYIFSLLLIIVVAVFSTETARRMFWAYAETISERYKLLLARKRFFDALTNLNNNLQNAAHNAEAGKWSQN